MRTLLVSCLFAVSFLMLAGCNGAGNGVDVVIEDGGQFPPSLAGTWRSDEAGWEFVFEPDGTISSAVVTLGRVRVFPGKVTREPMMMGGEAIYDPGKWAVTYSPATGLTVVIVLDRIHVELGKGLVEGSSRDVFVGEVPQDGEAWVAQWTSFTNYTAHTAEHPTVDLSSDPVYGLAANITFTKVPPAE